MKKSIMLVVAFITIFAGNIFAFDVQSEQKRVERLANLAKVWGTVKFFHPYPAAREIDWDRALIETIPKVNAARTRADYAAAINHLLSFLNDKNTRVLDESEPKPDQKYVDPPTEEVFRLEKGVLIIKAAEIARRAAKNSNGYWQTVQKLEQSYPQSKGVIFDLRGTDYGASENEEFTDKIAEEFLRNSLAKVLNKNITLGTIRYRIHSGYAPQTGGSSGGYYAGFTIDTPNQITGENKIRSIPIAAIIDDKSPSVGNVLSGLQAADAGFVIQENALSKEHGIARHRINLTDGLKVMIRTVELVNPDGKIGFQADSTIASSLGGADRALAEAVRVITQNNFKRPARKYTSQAVFQDVKDNPYQEMKFPNSEYRLLALFRFWNVINYFFPYKNLIDGSWDDILTRYIPLFENNRDGEEYVLTIMKVAAEIQDSHGSVTFQSDYKVGDRLGNFYPPVFVRFAGKSLAVVESLEQNPDVRKGDEILTIDGETVEKYLKKIAVHYSTSTPQSFRGRIQPVLLRGQKDSKIKLSLRGVDGSTREVELTRTIPIAMDRFNSIDAKFRNRTGAVVQILSSGFGYVDLARLPLSEVDKMFETIKNTPAVIFDMRGYPRGTAWKIAPRLTERENVPAALFSRPFLTAKNVTGADTGDTTLNFTQYLPKREGDVYKGKVVMLINESAGSQAEHTAMFFESATDVTFVGSPTAGVNGDVTRMTLPGSITVNFTGHGVRRADGRQLQQVGIQPDIYAVPTIKGINAGEDEILDAAVVFLQSGKPISPSK